MPQNIQGSSRAAASNEGIIFLGSLNCQPLGNYHFLDVPPHSAQSSSVIKSNDTQKLKSIMSQEMASYSFLKSALEQKKNSLPGGVHLKVLFVLGEKDSEKDIDNMLKWFLDIWKDCIGCDDSHIMDLRAMKMRSQFDKGYMAMTIATASAGTDRRADLYTEQMKSVKDFTKLMNKSGIRDDDSLEIFKLMFPAQ